MKRLARALAALTIAGTLIIGTGKPANAQRPQYVTGWNIVQTALTRVGDPYVEYGYGPYAFNCVGLISWTYAQFGLSVPANLWALWNDYPHVSYLQPGDVVLFQGTVWPGLSHAGIYIGGGEIVAADWYTTGVEITRLADWGWHYLGAVRIL